MPFIRYSLPGNFTQTLEISLIDSEEEATSITPANGEEMCALFKKFLYGKLDAACKYCGLEQTKNGYCYN
uniref:Uncharacterized protein n=1 Tax=Populus trichocarpa TaxID=3694 RepID=A0A2K1Y1C2_POPTR